MKFTKSIISLVAVTLGSATPVANHAAINITNHAATNLTKAALSLPSCTLHETWIHWEYNIWVGEVDDIPGKCGGLWDNLPKVECAAHQTYCGGDQSTRLLHWHFQTTDLCGARTVENTYEAAMSDYSNVKCEQQGN